MTVLTFSICGITLWTILAVVEHRMRGEERRLRRLRSRIDDLKTRLALTNPMPADSHVLVHEKGGEKFVLVWRQNQKPQAIRTLVDWADNKEVNFDWSDYSRLVPKVRAVNAD